MPQMVRLAGDNGINYRLYGYGCDVCGGYGMGHKATAMSSKPLLGVRRADKPLLDRALVPVVLSLIAIGISLYTIMRYYQ